MNKSVAMLYSLFARNNFDFSVSRSGPGECIIRVDQKTKRYSRGFCYYRLTAND